MGNVTLFAYLFTMTVSRDKMHPVCALFEKEIKLSFFWQLPLINNPSRL